MPFERYFYSSPDSGFYPSKRERPTPLLTDEFALHLYSVSKHFSDDLPVASLVVYSDKNRNLFRQQVNTEIARKKSEARNPRNSLEIRDRAIRAISILEQRHSIIEGLPLAPLEWRFLLDPEINPNEIFSPAQKQVLIKALKTTLKVPGSKYTHEWLDSQKVVADLRAMDFREEQIEEPGSGVTRTMVFLATAF